MITGAYPTSHWRRGRNPPWTGHQSVTEHTHHSITHPHSDSSQSPISLVRLSLVHRRKPENTQTEPQEAVRLEPELATTPLADAKDMFRENLLKAPRKHQSRRSLSAFFHKCFQARRGPAEADTQKSLCELVCRLSCVGDSTTLGRHLQDFITDRHVQICLLLPGSQAALRDL